MHRQQNIITSEYVSNISLKMTSWSVETCSWLSYYFHKVVFCTAVSLFLSVLQHNGCLSYYFHKVVFFTVVSLFVSILQHNGMHKLEETENVFLLNTV